MSIAENDTQSSATLESLFLKTKVDTSLSKRRGQMDLFVAILKNSVEPVRKTHLIYAVGINYYQVHRYLQILMEMGMIEPVSEPFKGYRTSEKGKTFLKLMETDIAI